MYTMVLMMAVTSSGDVSGFGHKSGCHGAPASCHGTVAVASSCTGTIVASGCTGHSCQGSTCHGSKAGIFGLRGKLFGGSCHGTPAPVAQGCCPPATPTGCTGGVITMPPVIAPKDMPKPMDKKEDPKPKTESN